MKLKYIFASIVATLALAVSCEKEADHYLDVLKLSTSYVALPTAGGAVDVTYVSTDAVAIGDTPDWLNVSFATGTGTGEGAIRFSAGAGEGRTAEIKLTCAGKTQFVNVIQGIATVSNATCAEIIAGPDSKTYRVTGICTGIYNTTYGNWYLNDGTGEITIYGTLDAKGQTKNFLSLGLEVGDEVTVEGPKTTYNTTVELVDVTVIKINKSLIKVDEVEYPEGSEANTVRVEGGAVKVTLANKGNGVYVDIPEDALSWLSITSLAGNVVTFTAAPNQGGDRQTTVTFRTTDGKKEYSCEQVIAQKGAILEVSIAEFLAAPVGTAQYKITGAVTSIVNATYGNVNLKDYSGEVYVYGIGAKNEFETLNIQVGDVVTLVGQRGEYQGTAQMTKGQYVSHIDVTEADIPTILAAADGGYYRVSGTVKSIANATYGNLTLTDGTNDLYVYGTYPGWGASGDARKGVVAAQNIEEGDVLTVYGPKSTYSGTPQINGGFFWSLVKADPGGGDEPGGDEPGTLGQFDSNVTLTKGTSCYDDNTVNITYGETITENVQNLKFGTSSKFGDGTVTLPAGTTSVSFYAVAWKNAPASLKFTVGSTEYTFDVAANDGASNSAPYNITVADTDKYTLTLGTALTAETSVKVETFAGTNSGKRAFIFGVQAVK